MVDAGIIGLGPVWESRYLPALEKLRERIAVRTVFDPVIGRAQQAADQLRAVPFQGINALLQSAVNDAVLVFDPAWFPYAALSCAVAAKRPAYVAGSLGTDVDALGRIHNSSLQAGVTLMPEFGRRYTPATARLQELMATRLGRASRIVADAGVALQSREAAVPGRGTSVDFLVGLIDWFRYILRSDVQQLQCRDALQPDGPPGRVIDLQFQSADGGEQPMSVELRMPEPTTGHKPDGPGNGGQLRFEIVCERGTAVLDDEFRIRWTAESDSGDEALTADRNEVEVMLDHFCRRVVGGLLPVPDLSDVLTAIPWALAARESLHAANPSGDTG